MRGLYRVPKGAWGPCTWYTTGDVHATDPCAERTPDVPACITALLWRPSNPRGRGFMFLHVALEPQVPGQRSTLCSPCARPSATACTDAGICPVFLVDFRTLALLSRLK